MKPLLPITLLLAVCVLACTSPVAPEKNVSLQKEDTMLNVQKNKEVVRHLYEDCLNKQDYARLADYVAEEYVGPGGHKGPDGFVMPVKPLLRAFPGLQWRIEELFGEADKVVVRWSWKATFENTFDGPISGPVAPTHQLISNEAIAIYQLRDGKVTNVWMQTDRLGFLQQIGLVSQRFVPSK